MLYAGFSTQITVSVGLEYYSTTFDKDFLIILPSDLSSSAVSMTCSYLMNMLHFCNGPLRKSSLPQ